MSTKSKQRKPVELDRDKTTPYARQFVGRIDRTLAEQVRMCNIPIFMVMSKTITAENYFINRVQYCAILGDNVSLLDRMMSHAICKTLADDISSVIEDKKSYVGVWDQNTVYNIIAAACTIMKNESSDELYLTGLQYASVKDDDDLKEHCPAGSYMPFSEYNPNRFTQMCMYIRNVALEAIGKIIEVKIPSLFLCAHPDRTKGDALALRFADLAKEYFEPVVKEYYETAREGDMGLDAMMDAPATEESINAFVKRYESVFLKMLGDMLAATGLSTNLGNLMLGTSRLHILYDDPLGKKFGDVELAFRLTHTNEDGTLWHVVYNTKVRDEITIGSLGSMLKTPAIKYGKRMRKYILDVLQFALNVYTATMRDNAEHKDELDDIDLSGLEDEQKET